MARILDGNLEIGAHVPSDLDYLTCSRHFFRSRLINYLIIKIKKRPIFLNTFETFSKLPSNINTMGVSVQEKVNVCHGQSFL